MPDQDSLVPGPDLVDFQHLFESLPDRYLVLLPNPEFSIVAASNAYLAATMTRLDVMLGCPLFQVFPTNPSDPGSAEISVLRASLERVVATREADNIEEIHYDIPKPADQQDGGNFLERHWRASNHPVIGRDGRLLAIIHRVEDITDAVVARQRTEEQLKSRQTAMVRLYTEREVMAAQLAQSTNYDPVTGLPNREHFLELLQFAMATAARESIGLTLMALDLDNFVYINNELGNESGNQVLRDVGMRLRESIRDSDYLARSAGDKFLLLSSTTGTAQEAANLAEKLKAIFSRPFTVAGASIFVSASIGIALASRDDRHGENLLHKAEAAVLQAKRNGRGRYEFYARELSTQMRQRLDIGNALQAALIGQQELTVHYQPRVDLLTRQVLGGEALARWHRPGIGDVAPDVFIPIAEQSALIHDLGSLVLDRVCRDMQDWAQAGSHLPLVSINISPSQFRGPRLTQELRHAIEARPELARRLELELTENILLSNEQETHRTFAALSRLGLRIAMDDFGTGCSGINYFRHFPIHVLKIDKSFIKNILSDRSDAMLTRSIVDLAHNFNLRVVAEGIETEEQAVYLQQLGCHEGQGYLFAPALQTSDFLDCWSASARCEIDDHPSGR